MLKAFGMKNACAFIAFMWCWCCLVLDAQNPLIPTDIDLSSVPSTDISLVKAEQKVKGEKTEDTFKQIITKALKKKTNQKNAKGSRGKNQKSGKKGKGKNKVLSGAKLAELQKLSFMPQVSEFLKKQLQDEVLQNTQISLRIKNVSIKDVLNLVSSVSDTQFVVDTDAVGQPLSFSFDNVSLSTILYSALMSNNPRLAVIKEFGIWHVVTMQTAYEFFRHKVVREQENDYVTRIFLIRYAKWNDALKGRLEKLWASMVQAFGCKDNSYLILEDASKKIFVRSSKTVCDEFNQCLQEIDLKIPQIRIDARVVLASKEFEESLGFRWSGMYNRQASVKHMDFVGVGPIENADWYKKGALGWALNFLPTPKMGSTTYLPFVFGNQSLSNKRLILELNAAENRDEIKTILKPSLLVSNEENAEILVGEEMPHEVRLDETVESKLTNVTTINYKDIGMKIKVKPILSPDYQAVFLDVFVENTEVARSSIPLTDSGSASPLTNFNYTLKTSRSSSKVLLKSGQTTLIGGLLTDKKSKDESGVPGLQNIPIIGVFFKSSTTYTADQQLLIFITPTIIET